MADNGMVVSDKGALVAGLSREGLDGIIKPLTDEIHLFDTFIAGTALLNNSPLLAALKVGDALTLVREDSKFDSNGIAIYDERKNRLGFVPEKDNAIFARLMDAGKMLVAKVAKTDKKGSFYQITIGIYLVDF